LDLAAIEARVKALESSEDWAAGRVALTVTRTGRGNHGVLYDDGDLCAEVHDNLGLGMDGKAYADFFVAAVIDIPALLAEVRRLASDRRKLADERVALEAELAALQAEVANAKKEA
jgi:hypothetical protein